MTNEYIIANALERTDPVLAAMVDARSSFAAAIKKRAARVEKYRRYDRGDHDNNLTTQQKKLLNIVSDDADLQDSNANYCGLVVDMMAGRLSVSEVTSENEGANEWISNTLNRNRFQSREGEFYRGAIRDCESYVIVDPQTAIWASEPAFDGYSGVVALYDTMTGLPIWACKLWQVSEESDISSDAEDKDADSIIKVMVYQQDKITYWIASESGMEIEPVRVDIPSGLGLEGVENGYAWPIGIIPVVQFANKRDNYTPYGESEIRPIVPLQDILNATLYDMQMASKLSAFKIYWSRGMEIDKDGIVPGSVINLVLKDEGGNIVTSITEEQMNFLQSIEVGEFGTTDMSQYTNQLDKLEREISQVSSTPIYGITSQGNLSGEALKQLESGLINKIYRFQRENADSIKMLLRLTAEIQRQFNVNQSFMTKFKEAVRRFLNLTDPMRPPAEIGEISVNWKSPEIVDVSQQISTLSNLRRDNPGLWPDEWYRERIGGLLDMTQGQVAEEGEKAQTEQALNFNNLFGAGGEPTF